MGRKHKRETPPERSELRVGGFRQIENHADGEWVVQSVTGSASTKTYRCPGCDMEIKPATPHIVAWPFYANQEDDAVGDRRHWHKVCWQKRSHRRPAR